MTSYAELPKPKLCRCKSTISCEQVNEEHRQIMDICKMTDNECFEFVQRSKNYDDFYNVIKRNLHKTNPQELKFVFVINSSPNVDSKKIDAFDEHLNNLHKQGYNHIILGTCDKIDFIIVDKINKFNSNHKENPIRTICLHSTSDIFTNAIKKNICYDCVIDFNNNKNVYGPLMLLYVDYILSFNCDDDNTLLTKIIKCLKIKPDIQFKLIN